MATACEVVQPSPGLFLDTRRREEPFLWDISNSPELLDLRTCILSGLSQTAKAIPSLLLWDEQGLRNFNEWADSPHYYLKSKEMEIFETWRDQMANALPHRSALVELGCGNLHKTSIILSALARQGKQVWYYALDVSKSALRQSLQFLHEEFMYCPNVRIAGLIGTYDDCVDWVAHNTSTLHGLPATFLWVGNSMPNLSKTEASDLMNNFRRACGVAGISCRFLVSADACADESRLLKAYDPEAGTSRTFLRHGLHRAKTLLGTDSFEEEVWNCTVEYDRKENEILAFYSPRVDVILAVDLTVHKGDKIFFFRSGKWNESQMETIAHQAGGFQVSHVWRDSNEEYGFYLLSS
ncbi:uncharacterized protein BO80DRAFT_443414 [Aspergillus ibericus CBS 121593]|uniref:Histidine-specific methyltransferase SAM-dependent domain-containing protein n=1 Tax=Aspergillus ibericus CBS 121593 TaxID=1448316 RepID=A0A395H4X1_9EURO|nr:hypothetical protein BO80DRAFT_443414 [Aspergillus ibericus CBS 121593]RAL02613.1 hypothetical protein BO80DRAFT_443414 [Aspergillus ibericus CBS 121593]